VVRWYAHQFSGVQLRISSAEEPAIAAVPAAVPIRIATPTAPSGVNRRVLVRSGIVVLYLPCLPCPPSVRQTEPDDEHHGILSFIRLSARICQLNERVIFYVIIPPRRRLVRARQTLDDLLEIADRHLSM
jgi:hypothetical protein